MKVIVTIAEASSFQNVSNCITKTIQIQKSKLLIGRGCQQIDSQQRNFGNSVSRKHAQIYFPASCFDAQIAQIPSYFFKLGNQWEKLPKNLLHLIRQFSKPSQSLHLKDLQSKYGLYQQVASLSIKPNLIFGFGSNFLLKTDSIHWFSAKEEFEHFISTSNQIQQEKHFIGEIPSQGGFSVLKFSSWNKGPECVLLVAGRDREFSVGRACSCDWHINRSQLSRRQGTIQYRKGEWFYRDGTLGKLSTNGTWQKITKRTIKVVNREQQICIRLGEVKLTMEIFFDDFTNTSNMLQDLSLN